MPAPVISKNHWINKYNMKKHPEGEGCYFEVTYRSPNEAPIKSRNEVSQSINSAIYFMMSSYVTKSYSAWHRMRTSAESWFFNYGNDIILYWIDGNGNIVENRLGLSNSAHLQVHVPANTWFCAVVDGDDPDCYALVSCSCNPCFDYTDYELADKRELIALYPQHKNLIEKYSISEQNLNKYEERLLQISWVIFHDILNKHLQELINECVINERNKSEFFASNNPIALLKKEINKIDQDGKSEHEKKIAVINLIKRETIPKLIYAKLIQALDEIMLLPINKDSINIKEPLIK
ncbi:MAG: cupin domain-containing protein [Proteobacteria bacterium]|nr:cupin domain-containing protein [Pseudomonadota bacterium]